MEIRMIRIPAAAALAAALLAAPSAAQTSAPAPVQAREARRISVSFREAETADVVRAFAEFGGHSIILGAGVGGTISAEVRNQPWDTALRAILRAYGYDVRQIAPGLLRVETAAQAAAAVTLAPLVTRAIRIRYIPAEDVARVVTPMLSARGAVVANEATNAIVVTDTEDVIERVVQLIGHG
jgi:type II secretory pathway component HofQ